MDFSKQFRHSTAKQIVSKRPRVRRVETNKRHTEQRERERESIEQRKLLKNINLVVFVSFSVPYKNGEQIACNTRNVFLSE